MLGPKPGGWTCARQVSYSQYCLWSLRESVLKSQICHQYPFFHTISFNSLFFKKSKLFFFFLVGAWAIPGGYSGLTAVSLLMRDP